ncbi:MAG: cytochrome c, class I [Gammaproteobacteria bacterium]|jgi:cytochrome c oxidase cbb3-type subunit 3|nr:cytochrome c, class I [Gammaproteobacteria bacterium]HJN96597.1 cytochrome c [Gammaproteobacteria bacterium]
MIRIKVLVCGFTLLVMGAGSAYADDFGKELYESNCAACHGDDGTALLPGTPHFSRGERLEKTDAELMESIVSGLKIMPPWAGIMSEKELEDCLAYLRLLGPAANSNSSDNGDDED